MKFFGVAAVALSLLPGLVWAGEIRVKDLVEFDGVRGNDLVGYGLVVGLNGTGDGIRNAPFTEEIMSNLLERPWRQRHRRGISAQECGGGFRDRGAAGLCPDGRAH